MNFFYMFFFCLTTDAKCDIVVKNQFYHVFFQVPFIAFYRKEYVEPELNINDLWKVWQWDEKVWLVLLFHRRNRLQTNGKPLYEFFACVCHFCFLDINIFILHPPVDSTEDPEAEPDASVSEDAVLPV